MSTLEEFAAQHSLKNIDGAYAGVYADMFMTFSETPEALCAHLYLDIPGPGKRARTELISYLEAQGERYGVSVKESANPRVLCFSFANPDTAISRMERFLSNCDTAYRAYGREMGILCARCRREMKPDAIREYVTLDGERLPLCDICANAPGETPSAFDNRREIAKKRARMGMLGAFTGMLVAAVAWGLLVLLELNGFSFIAVGVAFAVDYFYRKLGGIMDRWRVWILCIFSCLAVLLGNLLGTTLVLWKYADEMREAYGQALSLADYLSVGANWTAVVPAVCFSLLGVFFCVRGFRRRM